MNRKVITALSIIFSISSLVSPSWLHAEPKSGAPAKAAVEQTPELNKKILSFCVAHKGEQVGDGECANLVNQAYGEAGAKRHREIPKPDPAMKDDDYIWGKLLSPNDPVLPGDVIQLRDVKIVKKTGKKTFTETMTHHTAVVKEVVGKDHYLVLHQNSSVGVPPEKKKTVHDGDFDFNFKTEGQYWIYRPLPKEKK